MKKVIFSPSLKTIRSYAFSYCTSLSIADLPEETKDVGNGAFYRCAIKTINFPAGTTYISQNVCAHCKDLVTAVLPDGISVIEQNAFNECTSLTDINIPNSVIAIEDKALYNCRSLGRITISPMATRLGNRIFFPKMGQNMIPKLVIFCANNSPIQSYCKANNIRTKSAGGFPSHFGNTKNRAYCMEFSFWLADMDNQDRDDLVNEMVDKFHIPRYEAEDDVVEDIGYNKELHAYMNIDMTEADGKDLCAALPTATYIKILHTYEGEIDENANVMVDY